jgi:transposase
VLTVPPSVQIWLASEPVDMRRGHDGLMAIIRNEWRMDPFGGHLFAFVGKRRDRIKVLVWDQGGFLLLYKRLERGRFRMPAVEAEARTVRLDGTQLTMLLDGIDLSRVRRPVPWEPRARRGIDRPAEA